jgi:uncharacterized small protein (DUF1192 family)
MTNDLNNIQDLNEQCYAYISRGTNRLIAEIRELRESEAKLKAEVEKLQAFKDWVHNYLDGKGIPENPGGPHSAEGCRIGDRMDYVFAEIAKLKAEVERLQTEIDSGGTGPDACCHGFAARTPADWELLESEVERLSAAVDERETIEAAAKILEPEIEWAEKQRDQWYPQVLKSLRDRIRKLSPVLVPSGQRSEQRWLIVRNGVPGWVYDVKQDLSPMDENAHCVPCTLTWNDPPATSSPEPIPEGIYYNSNHDNFFDTVFRSGQGTAFHDKWHSRRVEFPQGPPAKPEKRSEQWFLVLDETGRPRDVRPDGDIFRMSGKEPVSCTITWTDPADGRERGVRS